MSKQKKQKPLSHLETAEFCNQMSLMLSAGISVLEAMNLLLEDSQTEEERALLSEMIAEVEQTGSLYKAAQITNVFPTYALCMFKLGEETGTLDTVTRSLEAHYTRESNLADMFRNALIYPSIMLGMMVLIILVLLTKVMPVFNQVFLQLGQEMSGLSAALLKIGETLSHSSVIFVILVIVLIVIFYFGRKHLPFQHKIQENVAACRFADGMAIVLKSGITPEQGLELVLPLVENNEFENRIIDCQKKLEEGMEFSKALQESQIFKGSYARMAVIAEKSGVMDEAMSKIASEYEYAVNTKINHMISLLEPTLVIVLSLIVGVILFSVMLPLLGIMSGL